MLNAVTIRATLLALAATLSLSAHAMADSPKKVDVPAGDLTTALETLAKQSGVEFVYSTQQLKGIHTKGVHGEFTAEKAVIKLLEGTKLKLTVHASGALLISDANASGTTDPTSEGQVSSAPSGAGNDSSAPASRDLLQLAQAAPGQTSGDVSVEKQDEQASKKKKSDQLQEVVVTGSRIPTAAGQLTVPVQIYAREDIDRSGQVTVADFLNTLPDVSTSYRQDGFATGIPGVSTVQLHGLPVGTTLTLLDGRRMEESGALGFVDLSNIPISAVERIEVIPVGTSAIYGADALAGAVNIILRKDFDGLEINGNVGHASDLTDKAANLAWGKNWDRGSVSLMGIYQDRGQLLGSERESSSTVDFPTSLASVYSYGDCSPGNVFSLNGANLPGLNSTQAAIPAGIKGKPTVQQFAATAGQQNECNAFRYAVLLPASRNVGVLLSGHFSISESIDLFTETIVSHTDRWSPSAPAIDVPSYDSAVLAANNPYNPFGEAVGVAFSSPGTPGPQQTSTESLVRPLVGIRGSVFSDWYYEATAYLSRNRLDADSPSVSLANVLSALGSSNPATALNPFTVGPPGPASLLQSLAAVDPSASYTLNEADQIVATQAVLRGPLLSLPAGSIQGVLGLDYSQEKQDTSSYSFGTPLQTELQRKSYAVFAESRVPLLGQDGSPTGARLALTVAGRYDHADDYGGKATWQSGLLWKPIDTLSFTGSYGVSYQAPTLNQIASPQLTVTGPTGAVDPFRGNQAVPPVQIAYGSNPNLNPETGNALTVGVKYSSQTPPGLRASLTYYKLTISNYIATHTYQDLIDNPSLFPGAVTRAPPSSQDQQLGYLGQILQINDTYYNFGDLRVAGVDSDASYVIESAIGRWTPSLAIAYVSQWQTALTPGSPEIDYVSQATNTFVAGTGWAPRWKGTAALAWQHGPLSLNVDGRYVGPYRDYQTVVPNSNELGNTWFVDLSARYEFGQSWAPVGSWFSKAYVALGVVDLLDKTPPFSYGGVPWDRAQYDIRGRYISLQFGVKL
jgi:iron complex outermembrane receptor protein